MENNLCARCTAQPFLEEQRWKDWNESSETEITLGLLPELRAQPKCPFCRLQLSAMTGGIRVHDHATAQWQYGFRSFMAGPLGTRLVFVDDSNSAEWIDKAGKVACKTEIDPTLVQRWLHQCQSMHGESCAPSPLKFGNTPRSELQAFRVIDVVQKCIVDAPDNCEYLALSYVWGHATQLRLSSLNQSSLLRPGSLDTFLYQIPETIKDAILLVSTIGKRYLWVDALCLVQDNSLDMKNGISSMDQIYAGAVATIIAASGSDANAGLPGLRPGSRCLEQGIEEVAPSLRMMVLRDIDDHLKVSKYSSRGWTFQEQTLSRRSIIFVNDRVYFRCRRCAWGEDNNDDDRPERDNQVEELVGSLIPLALDPDENAVSAFHLLLLYYSTRELSKDSDSINAFGGMLNFLGKRLDSGTLEGLPTSSFDISLLFFGSGLRRRTGFPSYSWAGWAGQIRYSVNWDFYWPEDYSPLGEQLNNIDASTWLDTKTWIQWFQIFNKGMLVRLPGTSPSPKTSVISRATPNFVRKLLAKAREKHSVNQTKPYTGYRNRSHPFLNTKEPPMPALTAQLDSSYSLLRFRTYSLFLSIADASPQDTLILQVRDREDRICGHVIPNALTLIKTHVPVELILLSESKKPLPVHVQYHESEPVDASEYPVDVDKWCFYWALLITWVNGVAERRGLCIIHKNAVGWSYPPGFAWKEITLG